MESNNAINALESDKREYEQKLYRYTGLIHAIEFFSQRFSIENIMQYVFDFTNELLQLDRSIIFFREGNQYIEGHKKGFETTGFAFDYERRYDEIVLFHAGLIKQDEFSMFFPEEICEKIDADYALPLIMDKSLFGVVMIKKTDIFSVDDLIIAEALMNLYSTALTNFQTIYDLEIVRKELDEKIFNLFAINQSSKALLSILEINQLFELSLSVFSELTQSSLTSFFIFDEVSEAYRLGGVIDVFNPRNVVGLNIRLVQKDFKYYKTVINYQNEKEKKDFLKYFINAEEIIGKFNPYYIITLAQEGNLLGFVTLSEKVNNIPYDRGVFELIESLASSTYIAFQNAKQLIKLNKQAMVIKQKFERLVSLNKLMQNINASKDFEHLMELTLKTLEISYHFDCCIAAIYDKEQNVFKVIRSKGINLPNSIINVEGAFDSLLFGETIYAYSTNEVYEAFNIDEDDFDQINIQGMIAVPIYIDDIELEVIGMICVMGVSQGSLHSEENSVTIETICHHIAPVIQSLEFVKEIKERYIENGYKKLTEHLQKEMMDAVRFDVYFEVIHVYDLKKFRRIPAFSLELVENPRALMVDHQNLFILTNDSTLFDSIHLNQSFRKKNFVLKKDFNTLDELYTLINE